MNSETHGMIEEGYLDIIGAGSSNDEWPNVIGNGFTGC